MRVELQRDGSAERSAKQLLNIGNGKMEINEATKCITTKKLMENYSNHRRIDT